MITFNSPTARSTDPLTSHEAAHDTSFKASKHRILAIMALHRFGPLTDYELADRTGLQQNSIGKRRKDCQDAGLVTFYRDADGNKIKRLAPSKSKCLVWMLTDAGVAYANDLIKLTGKIESSKQTGLPIRPTAKFDEWKQHAGDRA
jgi:DNA-binding MarR family transcriptional regulator